ncbi:MAG TPA: DUF2892 domain-containing protein [Bacteroidales bacterium]|nr:DUF2892 domain-containing protein [Bacteroidales bacterium]
MLKNIGSPDRIIRILIAVAIAVLYFTNVITGTLGIVLLALAGVLLITAVAGICPLYMLFGLRTRKAEK